MTRLIMFYDIFISRLKKLSFFELTVFKFGIQVRINGDGWIMIVNGQALYGNNFNKVLVAWLIRQIENAF